MYRHITSVTLAVVTTAVALGASGQHAQAITLSKQSDNLLKLDADEPGYADSYNTLLKSYNDQATDLALDFDDWFAMNSFVNHERAAYGSNGAKLDGLVELDLASLTWEAGASDVEVFFINEGAGYRNQFGYSTNAPTSDSRRGMKQFWNSDVEVIWDDIASKDSILKNNNGPLALGQGHQIGDVAAGDTVNFFIRNGKKGNGDVFDALGKDVTNNADGLQHVTTYQYEDFLVLAYEDLWKGGDEDYNDVVIAVRGLTDTETATVPEPTGVLGLLGLGVAGTILRRRQNSVA
jgi:hypothetical protein